MKPMKSKVTQGEQTELEEKIEAPKLEEYHLRVRKRSRREETEVCSERREEKRGGLLATMG